MGANSKIEWTDATWNPVRGCTRKSPGCVNCYAEVMAARFSKPGQWGHGFAHMAGGDHRWTGKIELVPAALDQPSRWRTPRRIFVNSMSDLFHESLSGHAIGQVFCQMAKAPHHEYQILTKRPDRMAEYVSAFDGELGVMPHALLGCSVENQEWADLRRPDMARIAALGWRTFVSYEPALGLVDWTGWEFLRWMISGSESGPHARPSHPDWHRQAREFSAEHDIPYFFKQWGACCPLRSGLAPVSAGNIGHVNLEGSVIWNATDDEYRRMERECQKLGHDYWKMMFRVGKSTAGRVLDGVTHDGFPGGGVKAPEHPIPAVRLYDPVISRIIGSRE